MTAAIRFQQVRPPEPLSDWPGPLDLEVGEGETCVVWTTPPLTGPLLRMCTGLIAPGAGHVVVLGDEVARLSRRALLHLRRRMGVAFKPVGLVSNLTLRMNLIVPLLYSGRATLEDARRTADELLHASSLSPWAEQRPADVPPDIRKEAAIVRAIANEPELLLLEDPVESLRSAQAAWLINLCRQKAQTIFVTIPEPSSLLSQVADATVIWDEHGLRHESHEVGTR